MTVRIISKYGDLLKEYYASGSSSEIPVVGDGMVINGESYKVVNRTMDVDAFSYILEVWKVVENLDGKV